MMDDYGFFGLGWIGMIIQILLVVGIIYFIIKGICGNKDQANFQSEAILKERFTRGEISEEEYNHMKKVLKK